MSPTKRNSKVNSENSKTGGKSIPGPSSLNDEEISKALNELIPEPNYHGSKFLEKYYVPYVNKTVERILSENERQQKTPQLIVAELSSQGPTTGACHRKYILLSPAETADEQAQASTSFSPSSAHSSQSAQSPHYQLIDISGEVPVLEDHPKDLSVEKELRLLENYRHNTDCTLKKMSSSSEILSSEAARVKEEQKDEEIHSTLNKRPASPENPSSEEALKKQRVKEEKEEEVSENKLKKKLMMLRIKNKELELQRKQAVIDHYNLKSLHLKIRMGLVSLTDSSSQTGDTNMLE